MYIAKIVCNASQSGSMKTKSLVRALVFLVSGVMTAAIDIPYIVAQPYDAQVIRVNHPSLEKRNISSITQDVNGYIYFGSSSGVRRFDGRSVKVIRSGTGVDRRNINNPVKALHPMSDGTIWAALQNGGLAWFDAKSDSINYVYPKGVNQSETIYLDFRSIVQKSDHELFIGSFSSSTVYLFDVKSHQFTSYPLIPESQFSEFAVIDLALLSNGHLWVGTDLAGIVVLDQDMNKIAHYQTTETGSDGGLVFNSIRDIEQDSRGYVWVSTYTGGLHRFDPESERFTRPASMYADRSGRFGNVYDILIDDEDLIWVSTDDGLVVLNAVNQQIVYHFTYDPYTTRSLGNNQVRTIFKDKDGSIWIGNEHGGVHRVTISRFFRHGNPEPDKDLTTGLPTVRSFIQYDENTIWVGTQTAGIKIMSYPELQVIGSITHNQTRLNGLSNNGITYMYRDDRGLIWIGTWGGGLNVYNPATGNFTVYKPDPNDPYSISDDRIQFITQGSMGAYWIGTEGGLNLFTPGTGRFERIIHDPKNQNSLSSNSLQSLAFEEDLNNPQVFWIGSWYGLNRFDRNTGNITRYISDPLDLKTIASNHVLSIYDDGKGNLWLATFGGGLNKLNKVTGEFRSYLVTDGLPSNVIFAIQADENGYLWLSTNNGLSRFEPNSESFRNYGVNEGLVGSEFWWGSAYKLTDGSMLFGSTYGFTLFNPALVKETVIDPPLLFNNVRTILGDLEVSRGNKVEVNYDESIIIIEFAALDFVNAEKIQYAYIMEGLEDTWNYVGNVNIASYSNLPGGNYTFRVMSTNSEGIWSERVATLRIRIIPPFWQTTWFQIVGSLVALSLVVGIIMLRTRQIGNINRQLEQQVAERTKELIQNQEILESTNDELQQYAQWLTAQKAEIEKQQELILSKSRELQLKNDDLLRLNEEKNSLVGIVAHDLRSPLASITSGLQLIKMQPEMSAKEMDGLLNSMEELLNKQLSMIARILDTESLDSGLSNLRLERVDVNQIIRRILPQQIRIAAQKSITIRSVLAPGTLLALADVGFLEQVVDNLISNAIKFSSKDNVVIVLTELGDNVVRIGVKDYGPGISADDQQKLFRKFNKLAAKPTAGESTTGLGLSIVKRFVEAMNGRVWCDSELGEGSTFWIELPIN
jgi:signal transduction histidine kinase/ligand-binding sensor domain-containing protein